MGAIASQITSLTIVYSLVYSDRSKKTSKLHVTGLCVGHSPGTSEFPAPMASNAEKVSIWWRHHAKNTHNKHPIAHPWAYGVSSVTLMYHLFCMLVTPLLYSILCYVGPYYNSTWLWWSDTYVSQNDMMTWSSPLDRKYRCLTMGMVEQCFALEKGILS